MGILQISEEIGPAGLDSSPAADMEVEPPNVHLPDDLIERIIAKIPFPQIWRARTFSKSWRARFSPSSASQDEGGGGKTFQELVTKRASNWITFCPVRLSKGENCAYDPFSQTSRRAPSLSFLPPDLPMRSPLDIQGPLVLFRPHDDQGELCVANILTLTWKLLHCPNLGRGLIYTANIGLERSRQTYKVIIFCQNSGQGGGNEFSSEIYDSKTGFWTSKKLVSSQHFDGIGSAVYRNGILYMLADYILLLVFNVEEETMEEFDLLENIGEDELDILERLAFTRGEYRLDILERHAFALVACNAGLHMVAYRLTGRRTVSSFSGLPLSFHVLKIDLGSRRLAYVAKSRPFAVDVGLPRPMGEGDYILFGVERSSFQMLAYSVHSDEWSCLPSPSSVWANGCDACLPTSWITWGESLFRPGLNPFVAV